MEIRGRTGITSFFHITQSKEEPLNTKGPGDRLAGGRVQELKGCPASAKGMDGREVAPAGLGLWWDGGSGTAVVCGGKEKCGLAGTLPNLWSLGR